MSQKALATRQPAKIGPKRLNADILDESKGISSYKAEMIRTSKPKNPIRLGTQTKIKNTNFAHQKPIKLNPKYTFNLGGSDPKMVDNHFQKKTTSGPRNYTEVSGRAEQPSSKFTYVYGKHVKTPGKVYQKTSSTSRNYTGTANIQPTTQATMGVRVPTYHNGSQKRGLYANRPKSRTETTHLQRPARQEERASVSSQGQSTPSQGNRSILSARNRSPMNPLKTMVFMDTSTTSPRKIRLPNSTRPDLLDKGRTKKIILNKAQFIKKSAKKISSDLFKEDGRKVPSKTRFKSDREREQLAESRTQRTTKIIEELVSENRQVEREFRANSQIRREQKKKEEAGRLQMPEMDTSAWDPIEAVNINNINTFGLDRHDRFPTGNKFSLETHRPNDAQESNWLMSKYNQFFGKAQHKNAEFIVPKEIRNYSSDYDPVTPQDLKRLLVKEQIQSQFDQHLLRALMNWSPHARGLEDSFERLEAKKVFGGHTSKVRRADQSKIKAAYWNQKSEGDAKLGRGDVRRLQKLMKEARDTLSIIQHSMREARFKRRTQEINFSPEEIRKIFEDSNHERMTFFFRKYRGILADEDLRDNILFIENQLHGVEDQLNSMTVRYRQRHKGRETLFQKDSERYSRHAAALLKKVRLMRETLRVSKKVRAT